MKFSADDEAALAVMAALTAWYDTQEATDLTSFLGNHEPGTMIAVLFGLFTAAVEDLAEIHEMTPTEWVQGLALSIQHELQ